MIRSPNCYTCKYYAKSLQIVCAVHPSGPDGDNCSDREEGTAEDMARDARWRQSISPYLSGNSDVPIAVERLQRAFESPPKVNVEAIVAAFRSLPSAAEASQAFNRALRGLDALESEDPNEAIARVLMQRFDMPRELAVLRVQEFCDRHRHLSPRAIYSHLLARQIRLRHGRLVPGRGLPKPPRKRFLF